MKIDADATPGEKLLRFFQKLVVDGRRHYLADLAEYLCCSSQTVIRLAATIERVVGSSLATGLENRRRWYQIKSISRNHLGLDYEELRYLSICRDLAAPLLPSEVMARVDKSIFNFSMLMADENFVRRENVQKAQFNHCPKGYIDYSPWYLAIEKLLDAREKQVVCLVNYKASPQLPAREHRFALGRLVNMNNALYALGAGVTEDFRSMRHLTSLAVHRIKDITLTDKPVLFKIPEEDLQSFGLPWNEPRKYVIQFNAGKPAQYVMERRWSDRQKISIKEDGGIILEIISRSDPEVMAWIRSFGEEASLLESYSLDKNNSD